MIAPVEGKRRLAGTVVPNIPTWCVFYDSGVDMLYTEPVMCFAVWAEGDEASFSPVPFSGTYLEELSSCYNPDYLGLSLCAKPERKDWEMQIRTCKLKQKPGNISSVKSPENTSNQPKGVHPEWTNPLRS